RMVLNAEANTSEGFSADPRASTGMHSWRYAYDDAGHLVGTSDARGCGKNVHYDRLSRVVAEDYSPCLIAQDPYTAYLPSTGAGAEVLNRFDFPEPGQTGDFGVSASNLLGRQVPRLDRGGYVLFGYDMRGKLGWAARRLPKPGSAPMALAEGWFRTR